MIRSTSQPSPVPHVSLGYVDYHFDCYLNGSIVTIKYALSSAGSLYCSAYTGLSLPIIQSTVAISSRANAAAVYVLGASEGILPLSNAVRGQGYTVLCFTRSLNQLTTMTHETPLGVVISQACKVPPKEPVTLSMFTEKNLVDLTLNVEVRVDLRFSAVPRFPIDIAIAIYKSKDCFAFSCCGSSTSYSVANLSWYPAEFRFESVLDLKQSLYFNPQEPGCYYVIAVGNNNSTNNLYEISIPLSKEINIVTPWSASNETSVESLIIYAFNSIEQLQLKVDTLILADEGTSMSATYNAETDRGMTHGLVTSPFYCIEIMMFRGANESKCTFVSDDVLIIELPSSASISLPAPGDEIIFLGDRVKPKCTYNCSAIVPYAKHQMIPLLPPIHPIPPTVSINGASQLPCCQSDLVLDVSASSGNGGRPWRQLDWTVVEIVGADAIPRNYSSLMKHMNEMIWFDCVHGLRECDAIPPNQLGIGLFSFILKLTNYLNVSAFSVFSCNVSYASHSMGVYIPGGRYLTVRQNDYLRAYTSTIYFNHVNSSQTLSALDYQWRLTLLEPLNRSVLALKSLSPDIKTFVIAANEMLPGYQYLLHVVVFSKSMYIADAELSVYIPPEELEVHIIGGSFRTLHVNSSLVLNTTRTLAEIFNSKYLWSCVIVRPRIGSCGEQFARMMRAETAYARGLLYVPNYVITSFQAGTALKISVVIADSRAIRTSTATVTVVVVGGASVAEVTSVAGYDRASTSLQTTYFAVKPLAAAVWITCSFSGSRKNVNQTRNAVLLTGLSEYITPCQRPLLDITLGKTYTVRLIASIVPCIHVASAVTNNPLLLPCGVNGIAVTQTTVVVNAPPSGGYLKFGNTVMSNKVYLSAPLWADVDLPLRYSFSRVWNESTLYLLRQRSTLSWADCGRDAVVAGLGQGVTGVSTLQVMVVDDLGGSSTAQSSGSFKSQQTQSTSNQDLEALAGALATDDLLEDLVTMSLSVEPATINSTLQQFHVISSLLRLVEVDEEVSSTLVQILFHATNQLSQLLASGGAVIGPSQMAAFSQCIALTSQLVTALLNLSETSHTIQSRTTDYVLQTLDTLSEMLSVTRSKQTASAVDTQYSDARWTEYKSVHLSAYDKYKSSHISPMAVSLDHTTVIAASIESSLQLIAKALYITLQTGSSYYSKYVWFTILVERSYFSKNLSIFSTVGLNISDAALISSVGYSVVNSLIKTFSNASLCSSKSNDTCNSITGTTTGSLYIVSANQRAVDVSVSLELGDAVNASNKDTSYNPVVVRGECQSGDMFVDLRCSQQQTHGTSYLTQKSCVNNSFYLNGQWSVQCPVYNTMYNCQGYALRPGEVIKYNTSILSCIARRGKGDQSTVCSCLVTFPTNAVVTLSDGAPLPVGYKTLSTEISLSAQLRRHMYFNPQWKFTASNDTTSGLHTSSYSSAKSATLQSAQIAGVSVACGFMLLFFCFLICCYNVRRTKKKYNDEVIDAWKAINNGEAGILYSPIKKWVVSVRKSKEYNPNVLSYESRDSRVSVDYDDGVRSSGQISIVFSDSMDDHESTHEIDDDDEDDKDDIVEVVIRTPRPSVSNKLSLRSNSSHKFEYGNRRLSSKDGESFFSVI